MANVMRSVHISDAIGQLANTLRGNNQRRQADEDQQAQVRAQGLLKHAIETQLPQAQWGEWRRSMLSTDPAAAKYIPIIEGMPPNQYQAALEVLDVQKRRVEMLKLQDQEGEGKKVLSGAGDAVSRTVLHNPGEIGKEPYREQQLSDILKGDTGASPDQVAEARIAKKIQPTADVALVEETQGPFRTAQTGLAEADTKFTAGPKTARESAEATYTAGPRTQETLASAGKQRADARAVGSVGAAASGVGADLSGEEFLKSVPESYARTLKVIGEYKADLSKIASTRNPKNTTSERMRLLQDTLKAYPNFDPSQFGIRYQMRKDFEAGGKQFTQVKSLNQLIAHIDEAGRLYPDMKNVGGVPLVNTAANIVKNTAARWSGGGTAQKQFDISMIGVATELAAQFKGGSAAPTETEIKEWRAKLPSSSDSEEQIKAGLLEALNMVASRIGIQDDQWNQTMGDTPRDIQILDSKSRAIVQKFGIDPDALEHGEAAPLGGAQTAAPSATQAPGQAEDIITTPDGKKWRKVPGGRELIE